MRKKNRNRNDRYSQMDIETVEAIKERTRQTNIYTKTKTETYRKRKKDKQPDR